MAEDHKMARWHEAFIQLHLCCELTALAAIRTGLCKEEGDAKVLAAIAAKRDLLVVGVTVQATCNARAQAAMLKWTFAA